MCSARSDYSVAMHCVLSGKMQEFVSETCSAVMLCDAGDAGDAAML